MRKWYEPVAARGRPAALLRMGLAVFVFAMGRSLAAAESIAWPDALAPEVANTLIFQVQGHFSVYLEDLVSGESLGIDPDATYNAWSLLKIAVMAAVLKNVEQGRLALDDQLVLRPQDIDTNVPVPIEKRPGDTVTVREMLDRLIRYSDNTASFVLARVFNGADFQAALQGLGLPHAAPGQPRNYLPPISPRQMAAALRCLHAATFLSPDHSRYLLGLMQQTVYESQLCQPLPRDIPVAHKVGFNAAAGDFHDCGIVYLPGRPYILCVMSRNSTREESDRVISAVSRLVFEHRAAPPVE